MCTLQDDDLRKDIITLRKAFEDRDHAPEAGPRP